MSFLRLVAILVSVAGFAGAVLAHGGEYLGPSGNAPQLGPIRPGLSHPTDPDPGGSRIRPTPPRDRIRRHLHRGDPFLDWDYWWDHNQLRFICRELTCAPGSTEAIRSRPFRDPSNRPEILAALSLALRDEYYDTRAAAVIAYGKVADPADPEALAMLRRFLGDEDKIVQESTCLGLGILGNKAAVPDLLEIAKNTPKGRKLVGTDTSDVPTRTRSFASVAIGLIGAREGFVGDEANVLNELADLAKIDAAHIDIQMGPAIALQLVKSEKVAQDILAIYKDTKAKRHVRAHLAVALGKIGYRAAIQDLRAGLRDKETYVNYGSAISLGLLANKEDKDIIKELVNYGKRAPNLGTKNFAIMALGEIGDESGRATLMEFVKGGQLAEKTFAALGLGVMGTKNPSTSEESGQLILESYKAAKNDPERSAFAIGLGILGHRSAAPTLREDLQRDSGSNKKRGYLCLALGLLGDLESRPILEELVARNTDWELRQQAAIGLGLIRDERSLRVLEQVILKPMNGAGLMGAAAMAIGNLSPALVMPILSNIIENRDRAFYDSSRAYATAALGILGDKDDFPVLDRIRENTNYLASSEALEELLRIL